MAAAEQVFIAHIAGHALGGGLEIALACDLRYASEGRYKLGTPEVTLGLLPGNGGTQRLTRLIGPSRALDLLLTGRTFGPDDALQWGLVSDLCDEDGGARAGRAAGRRARARARGDQALRARGRPAAARRGARARGRADRAAVPLQGRDRGHDGVRREARPGVRRARERGDRHPHDHQPRHGRGRRRGGRGRAGAGRRGRPARRTPRSPRGGGAATRTAARSCTPARRPSRRTSTSSCRSSSPSRARRSARPGSSCTRRRRRSSTTPGCARQVRGAYVHGLDPGVDGRVLRRPLGVVAAIVPWNFPTTLLCNKLGPALLCGNTVVAKPADSTPLTTLRLGEILREAGLPEGVLTVLPGTRRRGGRGARDPSARAQGRVHGLDADRRARGRAGREGLQARHARARRLGPDDHLRRRRPREGRERGEHGPLLQLRPGVPGDQARLRLRVGGRRGDRGDRRQGARLRIGIGSDPEQPDRAAALRAPARRARAPDRRQRRARSLAGGARPGDPALANGWFHEPTVVLEPGHDSPMAQRGGLRPGAADLARARHGRGDRARQRLAVRPRLVGLDAPTWIAPSAPRPSSTAATRGSTRPRRSTTSCRSAASRRAATARSTARRRSTTTRTRSPWW